MQRRATRVRRISKIVMAALLGGFVASVISIGVMNWRDARTRERLGLTTDALNVIFKSPLSPSKVREGAFDTNGDYKLDQWSVQIREGERWRCDYFLDDLDFDGTPDVWRVGVGDLQAVLGLGDDDNDAKPDSLGVTIADFSHKSTSYNYQDLNLDGILDAMTQRQGEVDLERHVLLDGAWLRTSTVPTRTSDLREARIVRADGSEAHVVFDGGKWQVVQGADTPWDILNQEAAELYRTGRYDRAVVVAKKALEVAERNVGPNHPDVAASLNNLAMLHQAMADYGKAKPLYEKAMEICRKALGDEHPSYAKSLSNLAALYQMTGEYAKAEPLYEKAMEICRKVLGDEHPNYGKSVSSLGAVYTAMGDYAKAEPLCKKGMEILRKALGEQHPDYAKSVGNLAALYEAVGEYTKAEPLYQQVIEIDRRALGEQHPDYATDLKNLAALYRATKRDEEAEALEQRAARIRGIE